MSKQPGKSSNPGCQSRVGDLVYLHCDRNKTKARDRYIVVSCDGEWRHISKFCASQLRRTAYRVKDSDCFLVPSEETKHDNVSPQYEEECDEPPYESPSEPNFPSPPPAPPIPTILSDPPIPNQPLLPEESRIFTETVPAENAQFDDVPDPPVSSSEASRLQPTRNRRPPKWLSDYVCD